jgi:hypothetical protein
MNELMEKLSDIREAVARLEERTMSTNDKIDNHIDWCTKRDIKIDLIEEEVREARGAIKTVKWLVPLLGACLIWIAKAFTSWKT